MLIPLRWQWNTAGEDHKLAATSRMVTNPSANQDGLLKFSDQSEDAHTFACEASAFDAPLLHS